MKRLVFLLEEYSMKLFIEALLKREFPGLPFLCVVHEGKHDLQRSIPRKLRAWREPGVKFVVLHDGDGEDCVALKARLRELCREGRREDVLIRIVCQELEAWYIGDEEALANAYEDERLRNLGSQARYRDPDSISKPARVLETLTPKFQKVSGARLLGGLMRREENRSKSFQVTMEALAALAAEFDPS